MQPKNRFFFLNVLALVLILSVLVVTRTSGNNTTPPGGAEPPAVEGGEPPAESGGAAVALTPLLQYQGRLSNPSNGRPVADGSRSMTFRIYNVSSAGSALWTETKSVAVVSGVFSTALGSVTALPQSLFSGQALWLGVTIGADPETSPRQQLMAVGYALSLVPGAVINSPNSNPALSASSTGTGAVFTTSSSNTGTSAVYGGAGTPAASYPGRPSGVYGSSASGFGVYGVSDTSNGVFGVSDTGNGGVFASNTGTAVYAYGNIAATGEIRGQYTALPVAHGHVNFAGTLASGSANVSSVWVTSHYEITLSDETYYYTNYSTVVTPVYGCPAGNVVRVISGLGKIWIYILTSGGASTQCEFQFITFKP